MTFDDYCDPAVQPRRRRPMADLLAELRCPHCGDPIRVFPVTPVSASAAGAHSHEGRGALVPARQKVSYL